MLHVAKHVYGDSIGSCAITYEKAIGGPVTEEHDYFAKALQLHSQCNVLVSQHIWSCLLVNASLRL